MPTQHHERSYSNIISNTLMHQIRNVVHTLNLNQLHNILSEGNSDEDRQAILNYALQFFLEDHFSADQNQIGDIVLPLSNPDVPIDYLAQQWPDQELNTPEILPQHNSFLATLLREGANLFEYYELSQTNHQLLRIYVDDYTAPARLEYGSTFRIMLEHIVGNNQQDLLLELLNINNFREARFTNFQALLSITYNNIIQDVTISEQQQRALLEVLGNIGSSNMATATIVTPPIAAVILPDPFVNTALPSNNVNHTTPNNIGATFIEFNNDFGVVGITGPSGGSPAL